MNEEEARGASLRSGDHPAPLSAADGGTMPPLVLVAAPGRASKGRAGKRRPANATEAEIPPSLDTEVFRGLWADWLQHRVELKKPATPTAQKRMLARLEKLGVGRAIAALEATIENGWKGVWEPKANGSAASPPAAAGPSKTKRGTW
jgi:hypothetical protein